MKKSLLFFLLLLGVVCVGCQNKDNSDKVAVEESVAVVEESGAPVVEESVTVVEESGAPVVEENQVPENDNLEELNSLFEKGNECLDKGDINGAIEQFNKALKINDKADWIYGDLGRAKQENKDLNGAIECYTKAIELNNGRSIYYQWRANAYSQLGKEDLAGQDIKNAENLKAKGK